jgi:hypothetical protein
MKITFRSFFDVQINRQIAFGSFQNDGHFTYDFGRQNQIRN